jgi:hypothetical protein
MQAIQAEVVETKDEFVLLHLFVQEQSDQSRYIGAVKLKERESVTIEEGHIQVLASPVVGKCSLPHKKEVE